MILAVLPAPNHVKLGLLDNMPVYVDESLAADEAIVFNAGTHHDAIRIRYDDFVGLAKPKICSFTQDTQGRENPG